MQEIDRNLDDLSANIHKNMIPVFDKWYKKWATTVTQSTGDNDIVIQDGNTLNEDFGLDDIDFSDKELNTQVFEK